MKYKLRYTGMALLLCALLGWDLAYEYQKPDTTAIAVATTPHPVVHSITHLMAPAYIPPVSKPTPIATSTVATSTVEIASSTPVTVATSTVEVASSTPTEDTAPSTTTPASRSKQNGRPPKHGAGH